MRKIKIKMTGPTRPIYKRLLVAAIVIYVIGSCIIYADIYQKLGEIEHRLMCPQCEHKH